MLDKVVTIRTALDLFEVINLLSPVELSTAVVEFKLHNTSLITSTACITLTEDYVHKLEITVGNDNFDANALGSLGIKNWGPKELLDDFADPEVLSCVLSPNSLFEALREYSPKYLGNMKLVFTASEYSVQGKVFSTPRTFIISLFTKAKHTVPFLTRMKNFLFKQVAIG